MPLLNLPNVEEGGSFGQHSDKKSAAVSQKPIAAEMILVDIICGTIVGRKSQYIAR